MIENIDYKQEANKIINYIKNNFVLPSGSLSIAMLPNGRLSSHSLWADFGDWAPFFLYWQEEDFVEKQLAILDQFLKNGVLLSDVKFLKLQNWSKSYEYSDFLLGLLDYHFYKNDNTSLDIFLKHLEIFIQTFYPDNKAGSFFYTPIKKLLPIIDTRDTTLVEIFLAAEQLRPNGLYLKKAENILSQIFSNDFFDKYNLLPNFISYSIFNFSKKFKVAQICKNNTNTLFALLAVLEKTGKGKYKILIDRLLGGIFKSASIDSRGIIYLFDPKENKRVYHLTPSFAVLDFLVDYYNFTNDQKILHQAKLIADFWLTLQGKTGLFPVSGEKSMSYFDSETDMAVALYKLAEKTNEAKYFEAADKCFYGLIKYHCENNYPLSVDIDTGLIINPAQKTKYITLFLKLLILKNEIDKGGSIYGSKNLFDLLKDR